MAAALGVRKMLKKKVKKIIYGILKTGILSKIFGQVANGTTKERRILQICIIIEFQCTFLTTGSTSGTTTSLPQLPLTALKQKMPSPLQQERSRYREQQPQGQLLPKMLLIIDLYI